MINLHELKRFHKRSPRSGQYIPSNLSFECRKIINSQTLKDDYVMYIVINTIKSHMRSIEIIRNPIIECKFKNYVHFGVRSTKFNDTCYKYYHIQIYRTPNPVNQGSLTIYLNSFFYIFFVTEFLDRKSDSLQIAYYKI